MTSHLLVKWSSGQRMMSLGKWSKSDVTPGVCVEGRRSKDKGRRTKVEGQRSKDKGRRTKGEGQRSNAKGQISMVNRSEGVTCI